MKIANGKMLTATMKAHPRKKRDFQYENNNATEQRAKRIQIIVPVMPKLGMDFVVDLFPHLKFSLVLVAHSSVGLVMASSWAARR